MSHEENPDFFKGRGAQVNIHNKFLKNKYVLEHIEGLDEPMLENSATQIFEETPKKIVSESNSPDLSHMFSINPYQGCEHGCIYCYARNTHEYYGFSAGLDFERKIIVKRNAAELLEQYFNKKNYEPVAMLLSGNTDCYQPMERKLKITRSLLQVFLRYRNPVSIITKNNVILRDLDILSELSKLNLVHANISITSLNEQLRQRLEPRTVTATGRLAVIQKLTEIGVPVRVMAAPIIPGLNSNEVPAIIKAAADRGALAAGFTIVRLNGSIAEIFTDWIHKAFPDRAEKVLNMIKA
jgi:DNA repair photolyase